MFILFQPQSGVTPGGQTAILFWYWLLRVSGAHRLRMKSTTRLGGTGGVPRPTHFLLMGCKCGGSHDPLWVDNLLEQLTEFRKVLYLGLQFYYRGRIESKVWEGPECRASVSSPHGMRVCHPPGTSVCSASGSRDIVGVLSHGHRWLNHWPCDWTQSPDLPKLPEVWRLGWEPILSSCDESFWWPAPILKLSRGPPQSPH